MAGRNVIIRGDELFHWGIKGQKWGVRRYQNEDGTLTEEGKRRYYGKDLSNDLEKSKEVLDDIKNMVRSELSGTSKAVNDFKQAREDILALATELGDDNNDFNKSLQSNKAFLDECTKKLKRAGFSGDSTLKEDYTQYDIFHDTIGPVFVKYHNQNKDIAKKEKKVEEAYTRLQKSCDEIVDKMSKKYGDITIRDPKFEWLKYSGSGAVAAALHSIADTKYEAYFVKHYVDYWIYQGGDGEYGNLMRAIEKEYNKRYSN